MRPHDSRAGFTLVEAMVTLILVSLLVLVLSAGVIGSQRLTGAATGNAAATARIGVMPFYDLGGCVAVDSVDCATSVFIKCAGTANPIP